MLKGNKRLVAKIQKNILTVSVLRIITWRVQKGKVL